MSALAAIAGATAVYGAVNANQKSQDAKGGGGGGGFSLPGVSDIERTALATAQGANAANLSKKSTDYATNAADQANSQYAAKAPLRTAGIAGLLNPKHPNLTGLDATRMAGNPFARPLNLPGVSGVTPPPGGVVPPPISGPATPPVDPGTPPGPQLPGITPVIPSGNTGQQITPADLVALMKQGPQSGAPEGAQRSAIQMYQYLNPDYADGTTS